MQKGNFVKCQYFSEHFQMFLEPHLVQLMPRGDWQRVWAGFTHRLTKIHLQFTFSLHSICDKHITFDFAKHLYTPTHKKIHLQFTFAFTFHFWFTFYICFCWTFLHTVSQRYIYNLHWIYIQRLINILHLLFIQLL